MEPCVLYNFSYCGIVLARVVWPAIRILRYVWVDPAWWRNESVYSKWHGNVEHVEGVILFEVGMGAVNHVA